MASQKSTDSSVPEPRKPQRDRGKARFAALLSAGEQVFAEKGYDAATMTEIAARAGASIGSLYQFFPTKELVADTLYTELRATVLQQLAELHLTMQGKPAASIAGQIYHILTSFIDAHPALLTLAERQKEGCPSGQDNNVALTQQRIVELLSLATPALEPGRPEVIAMTILCLIKAALVTQRIEDPQLREKVRGELSSMLTGGL